jgi:hypothetical protein
MSRYLNTNSGNMIDAIEYVCHWEKGQNKPFYGSAAKPLAEAAGLMASWLIDGGYMEVD